MRLGYSQCQLTDVSKERTVFISNWSSRTIFWTNLTQRHDVTSHQTSAISPISCRFHISLNFSAHENGFQTSFAVCVGYYLCRRYCKRDVIFLDTVQIYSVPWGYYWLLCRERGEGDTLEPHSYSLNLCYFSYSHSRTLSQLTWQLLMNRYYMPTPS